jgi:GNAT superfamily N-acetyltransferase
VRAVAIGWRRAQLEALCDRFEPWEHGEAAYATEFPDYYDYNTVRVEGPAPGLSAEALAAAADRLLADYRHRNVEVDHVATGERLRPGFEALGWHAYRLVWMSHAGLDALPQESGPSVVEVAPAAVRPLALQWVEPPHTPEEIAAHVPTVEKTNLRVGARYLAVVEDGEPVAYTISSPLGADAWMVDAVFVAPQRRGSGLGGALTAAAVRHAWETGAGAVAIIADDEGRPKDLYARLGFRPAWIEHNFLLTPTQRGV